MNSTPSRIPEGEFVSSSPEQTFNHGFQLGARLKGGEILLLTGALGAGKTIFVKGICAALGIAEEEVTSPSFTLVNPYIGLNPHAGRLPLYHIDLYRLDEGASAAYAVDLDELLSDARAVIVIEWAERMGNYPLPGDVWRVSISGDGDSPRHIRVSRSES